MSSQKELINETSHWNTKTTHPIFRYGRRLSFPKNPIHVHSEQITSSKSKTKQNKNISSSKETINQLQTYEDKSKDTKIESMVHSTKEEACISSLDNTKG